MASEIRTGIRLTGDASGVKAAMAAAEEAAKKFGVEIDRVSQGSGRLGDAIKTVGHYGAALAAATAGWNLAKQAVETADAMTMLQSRLKLVTSSAGELGYVQGRLFDVAQQSRVSFTELGATYAQIARATSALGVSHDRLLVVTQSIGQAMAISGGSAQSMQAALTQLSQGLASGTLRGEELNSILEQTPRLAQAIADGMGVSLGQLRALGQDGKLTAMNVVQALEKAGPGLKREFDQVAVTVNGAFTNMRNSSARFIEALDKISGASQTVAGAMQSFSKGVDALGRSINENKEAWSLFTTSASWAVVLGGGAMALGAIGSRVVALGATLAANPMVLAFLGVGAGVGALYSGVKSAFNTKSGLEFSIDITEGRIKGAEAALARLQAMQAPETGHETGTREQRQAQREAAHARNLAELRERIATERANLAALQTQSQDKLDPSISNRQLFNRFEREQQNKEESALPFPGAKPLEDVRKYYENVDQVHREANDRRVDIYKSFQNQIKLAASEDERLTLQKEMTGLMELGELERWQKIKSIVERGAAEKKQLAEAQFSYDKAGLELDASGQRQDIAARTRSNEQFYKLGLLDVNEYYQRKSALELQDLDISERLIEAELVKARAIESGAKKADDKLLAQARVLGLERELVELAGKRQAANSMPGEQAAQYDRDREKQVRDEISRQKMQSLLAGVDLSKQMDAETRQWWAVGSVKDPNRQLRAQLDEEVRLRQEAMDKITDPDAKAKATIAFNDWVVVKNNELAERLKPGYQKMLEEWADTTRLMRESYNQAMEGMLRSGEDEFVRSGGNLVSMTRAIGAQIEQELLRVAYRKYLASTVANLGGGIFDGLAKTLGLSSGFGGEVGAGMRANEASHFAEIGLKHTGGIVGLNDAGSRRVNMGVFAGAPRFHTGGITGEEVPIIAKKGEGVFTPGQMRAIGAGMSGGAAMNVTVINNTGTPVQARQRPGSNGMDMELVLDLVDAGLGDRMNNGQGSLYHSTAGRFGLKTAVA